MKSSRGCGAFNMNEELVKKRLKEFRWYQPMRLGGGIEVVADFNGSTIASFDFGLGRWDYIVKRNLPDVQGMRVLDAGCNSGLYCIELSRMGGREVVGIDSEKTWPGWMMQANFVKEVLEWRCNTKYNVIFKELSMDKIPEADLGCFDLALFMCCLYYLDEDGIDGLLHYFYRSNATVVIQCNTHRGDQQGQVAKRARPQFMKSRLQKVGYPVVWVDAPLRYGRPIVVGTFRDFRPRYRGRRDRLRAWIRSRI